LYKVLVIWIIVIFLFILLLLDFQDHPWHKDISKRVSIWLRACNPLRKLQSPTA